jgi:hypothetical protein
MIFIYRISDNSYEVPRLPNATKEYCFKNFLHNIFIENKDYLYLIADGVNPSLLKFLKDNLPISAQLLEVETGSNAASFRLQLSIASQLPDQEIVYLHEDDYLYKPDHRDTELFKLNNFLIEEGLKRADYVSLYDHPDKYLIPTSEGSSRVSFLGVEEARIFLTSGSHWKYTDSTTLTFASQAATLKEDMQIWLSHVGGNHPNDFQAFLELQNNGRLIATAIPGLATHADPVFSSPFTQWTNI